MCGIVGYVGFRNALDVVISGLEKLEYRGYDSAGVAVVDGGSVVVTRSVGKLSELKSVLSKKGIQSASTIGIGHTRWATHGKPSENNAHPHSAGRVSLIHNGIIENYVELRGELEREGCVFKSETDTEIAAHLLNKYLSAGQTPMEALRTSCGRIRGSYAFVALDSAHTDTLLVAKTATPIVLGIGENECIVASDIPALLAYTRNVIVLEDGDLAEIKREKVKIFNNGKEIERQIQIISWDPVMAQKGGFKHFMLKEIHEQVQALSETTRGRINVDKGEVIFPELMAFKDDLAKVKRISLVACGTAWHACLVAKFYFESIAHIPCEVDYASEFRYRSPIIDNDSLIIAISQSGETADTLAAVEIALKKTSVLAVCNVLGSSLARKSTYTVFTQAGPEISVASTKAFTTQLVVCYMLAVFFGVLKKQVTKEEEGAFVRNLVKVPSVVADILKEEEKILNLAKKFHHAKNFVFLGRGICYPIALEGALKLKEISYIHAEGYPAGEIKHGPLALIDKNMPVAMILQNSKTLYDKMFSNIREVEAREGRVICFKDGPEDRSLNSICDSVFELPEVSEYLSPIIMVIPLQLLAYYIAVLNGTDVDLPRNLAKSVTVE